MRLLLHLSWTLSACGPSPVTLGTPDSAGADSDGPGVDSSDSPGPAWPALVVNELMADGDPVDWIELYNPGAEAVDLAGWSMSDDWTRPRQHVFGAGVVVPAGGHLLLEAAGEAPEPGGRTLPFSLNAGGESLGLFAPDGEAVDWLGFPAQREGRARARLPDGAADWVEMPVGTPGAPNALLESRERVAVSAGATWRYRDDGRYPGAGWVDLAFDDAAWAEGPAPLGYGDELATEVAGGPSGDRHPSTWFRHRFSLDGDEAARAIAAAVFAQVDDGAVIWLNGEEVGRVRMASGELGPEDWAASTASGSTETTFVEVEVPVTALRAGENVLCVEVHQANASSSDIRLDAELIVQTLSEAP